jgi:O-antigen ligase
MPVVGGILVAVLTALTMKTLPMVWIFLIFTGLIVLLPTFIVKEPKLYWLAIFIFTLPLHITKMIGDSDKVVNIINAQGLPWGSLPGLLIYLSDLPFLILMSIWLFDVFKNKKKIYFPKLNFIALAFIGWSSLSLLRAPYPVFGIFELIRQIKLFIIYVYITNNIDSKKAIKIIVAFLLVGAFIQGTMVLSTYSFQKTSHVFGDIFGDREAAKYYSGLQDVVHEGGPEIRRGTSSIGKGGDVAKFFEFVLPLAFISILTRSGIKYKFLYSTVFMISLLGLYFTFSRGGLIGAAISLLVCLFLAFKRALLSRKWLVIFLFISIICTLVAAPVLYDYFTGRPKSFDKRFELYKSGIAIVADHPVFGVGLNNNTYVISKYTPGELYAKYILPIHNHFLIIAAETGIPGLIFFLWFFLVIIKKAYWYSKSKDIYIASLAIGIFAAYIAITTHMFVTMISIDVLQTLLWLFAGLIIVFDRIEQRPIQYI